MIAKVFFAKVSDNASVEEQVEALQRLYATGDLNRVVEKRDFVAIKFHVGEKNNTTHVKPELIRKVVDLAKAAGGQPFLTETSTLYKGERENAVKHLLHAHRHGFGIEQTDAPFIMADGLTGNAEFEIQIDGELHKSVKVAREIASADSLIVVSHATGHVVTGLGACIKNIGMGLASRMGKMREHSAMLPEVIRDKCRFCQKCIQWCPQAAIIEKEGKAFIQSGKCIGCGECLAVCRFDAVKYDWNAESGFTQKSMAEHAYGIVKEKAGKSLFINVLVDMTNDCDCFSVKQEKCIPDIGILASFDPVAIDKATLDLTAQRHGKTLAEMAHARNDAMIQIGHAAKVGMGSLEYELINV